MNESFKKLLNTISYTLNIVFIAMLIIGIKGVNVTKDAEPPVEEIEETDPVELIKECIIAQEKARLPLTKQGYERVHDITIDSLVITNNIEPYSGFLVTTWDVDEKQELTTRQWAANGYEDKYIRKKKVMYVEVSDIETTPKGEVTWRSNWLSTYLQVN